MKTKKIIKSVSFPIAATIFSIPAMGESILVAGWDYSQYVLSGANSDDYATFSGVWGANYSNFLDPSADIAAKPFGTVYYDGTYGSTTPSNGLEFNSKVSPATGDIDLNKNLPVDGVVMSDGSASILLIESGQTVYNNLSLGIDEDSSIVFKADMHDKGYGRNWMFSTAGKVLQSNGSAEITWSASSDGNSYVDLGITSQLTGSAQVFDIPLGAGFDGKASVYVKLSITGFDLIGERVLLDNSGLVAELSDKSDPSFWANSEINVSGWRDTSTGYPDEFGIGWIYDEYWPWIYTFGQGSASDGDWIYIFDFVGNRNGFWAWNSELQFWFYGISIYGGYYKFNQTDWYYFN